MDRQQFATSGLDAFAELAARAGADTTWEALTSLEREDSLEFLLQQLVQLEPAERVCELQALESKQDELGAGFYGMLPQQVDDALPVPSDATHLFETALVLAKARQRSLEAAISAFATYEFEFLNQSLPTQAPDPVPSDWSLEVDVSSFGALMDALEHPNLSAEDALSVARKPAFAQMLKHRRELGYVPEPLIDENGLAWCIQRAASNDPVDAIWRWLHPHNFFDLADVGTNAAAYRRLLDVLGGVDSVLADLILSRMAKYVPGDIVFHDRLRFAVGWAINGWATNESGGINLEHFKDNVERLLDTLTHETFHRLQLTLCPASPDGAPGEFETITHYPLADAKQEALYRALSYVALEGSATFVGKGQVQDAWRDDITPALDLLERVLSETDTEAVDGLLSEGLKSNGPFYGFGALLSDAIVQAQGAEALGRSLQLGGPTFVLKGLAHADVTTSDLLGAEIRDLVSRFEQLQNA